MLLVWDIKSFVIGYYLLPRLQKNIQNFFDLKIKQSKEHVSNHTICKWSEPRRNFIHNNGFFIIDIVIGEGQSARSINISLPKFTLIGATTRLVQISTPSRDIQHTPVLSILSNRRYLKNSSKCTSILAEEIDQDGTEENAKHARATPRIAIRRLKQLEILLRIKNMSKDRQRIG